ncbi:hypothetical protein AVEN_245080-1 [Araneus ventricosus]|uniref:Integrase zinc-binding domain-containing protein n=1 Tax=Araneus ventricosus TaxID=182803 RepID=A0A4Y2E6S1_ARAVE|nr:hypothetical protein AVEN_245080-1 [Araneus ventricosus]
MRKFILESQIIMSSGNFNLRKWKSNFHSVVPNGDTSTDENVSVLGLVWHSDTDTLSCKVEQTVTLEKPITKKLILAISHQSFDPIGFTTPIILIAKFILLYYRIVLDTARSKLGTFIQNRVREIRSLTSPTVLRRVPGSLNDADLVSRGCSGEQLLQEKWWEEPSWLSENEESWPKSKDDPDEDLDSSEKRKTIVNNLTKSYENVDWYYKYFSYVRKIVRMLAWIFRFYNKLIKSASDSSETLSVSELEKAEISLMLLIQKKSFKDVNDDKIKKLIPIIDCNDLIRAKTNNSNRDNTNDFKFPIILPSDHTVVKLLIINDHNNLLHASTFMLMSHLREKYRIIKTRRTIRNCIRKCVKCQRFKAKKCEVSKDRVHDAATFEIVGVDLAGPLYL